MKTQRINSFLRNSLLAGMATGTFAQASTDYAPAVWRPVCDGKWYTTGSGKKFYVIHDMEGYYLTGIAYLQRCDISTSVHYVINGLKDYSSDAARGEVSQLVRDTYYAWHARCWNQHSMGTEHEGFASNPAWYTPEMYVASASLTSSKATKYSFAKDRNHIVGHDADSSTAWVNWADTGLGIDPSCNTHHDPGSYWDWSGYMALINGQNPPYLFGTDIEGWTVGNGTSALLWNGSSWPGILYTDQTAADAYIRSPVTSFAGTANTVVNVSFHAQNLNPSPVLSHDMAVFWKTTTDNTWTASKSTPMVSYNALNEWVVLNLDVNNAAWTGKTVNQLRLDFDQVNVGYRWHVNHILLQTVPRNYFGANAESWTAGNGMSAVAWTATSWPGVIYSDQTANDGQLLGPTISYRGAWNDVIHVRVYAQNGTSANHDMQVYYKNTASASFTAAKSSAIVNYTVQNGWADVYLPVGMNTNWSGYTGQTITQLRLDVDGVSSATRFIIDSIVIEQSTNVVPISVADQIIDNTAATVTGLWSTGTSSPDKYGADYRFRSQGADTSYLQYTPTITVPGNYQVYEWHPVGSNRTTAAPHVIAYNGGTTTVNVNQQINGGVWRLLGTFNFATGTTGNVKITDSFPDATQTVMADAIKLVYVP